MSDNISAKLQQEFKDLPEGWIAMLESKASDSFKVSLEAIKILSKKNLTPIILSATRPCTNLLQVYKKNGINTGNLFILCCVCKSQSGSVKDNDAVLHLDSVSALTNISIALNKIADQMKGKGFFFIDSISTMLIHNKPKELSRFIHSILVKMRLKNMSGILISVEEETDKNVRAELTQLCDKVIKI